MRYRELIEAKHETVPVRGTEIGAWVNPTAQQLRRFVNDFGVLRGSIFESATYAWIAYEATHADVEDALHLGFAYRFVVANSYAELVGENDWSTNNMVLESHGVFFLISHYAVQDKVAAAVRLFPDWQPVGINN